MTVALIDTSVFCELLRVPHCCEEPDRYANEFRTRVEAGERFYLPLATILETGNHIGQNGDGNQRRATAERFSKMVGDAIAGSAAFLVTNFVDAQGMSGWIGEFPDWASRGSGLGDLSIHEEWDAMRAKLLGQRIYVWSKDEHLASYDVRT